VADFFCGSGTFPLVAARHGRRYLACDGTWRAIHTTRLRLAAAAQKPFEIYRQADRSIPVCSSSFSFNSDPFAFSLLPSTFEPSDLQLDYWEIDPAWNGKTFHSAYQAGRPNRGAKIPLQIKMPAAPTNICVRAITVNGEQIQLHV